MPEKDAPVSLVEYDPRWPRLFEDEKARLLPVLAPWLAGPIEHIGSTAVPGLAAKPVIDIMAGVSGLQESKDAIPALQSLGYLYAPYNSDAEHLFCKPTPSRRTHHLHIVPVGSPVWKSCITFRDRLRKDDLLAADYLRLKRSVAAYFQHDREKYTSGKTEFVTRVIGSRLISDSLS